MDSTIWDKIYKEYEKGGAAWYTLSRGLDSDFKAFVERTDFPIKKAFDIGFGTGHYLVWLKAKEFKVGGIDSSETAYKMAEKALGTNSGLICKSIYDYAIPSDNFGLIYSVHAIHHGLKQDVIKAINRIHHGLVSNGWVYMTLPKDEQIKNWESHKTSRLIAPGTYVPTEGPEKGLPHSYFSEDELRVHFGRYDKLKYKLDKRGGWQIIAKK